MKGDRYLTLCVQLYEGEYFILARQYSEGGHAFKIVN